MRAGHHRVLGNADPADGPTATTGVASCGVDYTPTAVNSGTHKITASYGGDTNHASSSNHIDVPVSTRSTSTSVSCSPSSVVVAQASTCTATISDTDTATTSNPSGTVSFGTDSTGSFSSSASCTLSPTATTGVASCGVDYTPTAVDSGTHKVTATYAGDSAHAGGNHSTNVGVSVRATSTAVSCSPNPGAVGHSSTCTATATDTDAGTKSAPSGSVSFASDSTGSFSSSGSCTLSPTGTAGQASCSVDYTPAAVDSGTHKITASYGADSTHSTSSNSTNLGVKFPSSTSLSCVPNPVNVRHASTCTATVNDTNSGTKTTPAGSVSFTTNSAGSFTASGSCTLAPTGTTGQASCQVSYTPTAAGSGSHTITASYTGDSGHVPSSVNTSLKVTGGVIVLMAPTIEQTCQASNVTSTGARLGGSVNPNGHATTAYFQYGKTRIYGHSTPSHNIGSSASTQQIRANLQHLGRHTTYHCRVVATSSSGTTYGTDQTFTTSRRGHHGRPGGLHLRSVTVHNDQSGCHTEAARFSSSSAAAGSCRSVTLTFAGSAASHANGQTITIKLRARIHGHKVLITGRARITHGHWTIIVTLPIGKVRKRGHDFKDDWTFAISYLGSQQLQGATINGSFTLETEHNGRVDAG